MKQFYLGLFRLCFKCQLVASVGYRLFFFFLFFRVLFLSLTIQMELVYCGRRQD